MNERDNNISRLNENARRRLDEATNLVMWTAPNGVVYIDHPETIREIIETASWR